MPFTLTPTSVDHDGDESVLRGRITAGAFIGPESVSIRARDGRECTTVIRSHGLRRPQGWPVLPEHAGTEVRLHVPRLPDDFAPCLVTGLGASTQDSPRVDASHFLRAPEFWACQLSIACASGDIDDPGLEFLGVSPDAADDWSRTFVDAFHAKGQRPCIRVAWRGTSYVELEMAAEAEYQDRFVIGDTGENRRVLLGYHSGHFSLPAFRLAEVRQLAMHGDDDPTPLLWLSATWLEASQRPVDWVRELCSRVPGVIASRLDAMTDVFIDRLDVEGLRWTRDPVAGWINNGKYSQRNPAGPMTTLSAGDFAFIDRFFA